MYLPIFQTADVLEDVITKLETSSEDKQGSLDVPSDEIIFTGDLENVTMQTAVSEVWELGAYSLRKSL